MEQKTHQLQVAVSEILRHMNIPAIEHLSPSSHAKVSESGYADHHNGESEYASPRSRHRPATLSMTREPSQEPAQGEGDGDSTISDPMASLYEVTKLSALRSNPQSTPRGEVRTGLKDDFIAQGRVSLSDAEELFHAFDTTLHQYLWGGSPLVHDILASARESSSLLVAAILAVTALHVQDKEHIFDMAYTEFLSLVSDSMFHRYHNLDDIRGFCIGAFWLSEVSWKLSGHAVRIATELGLHQSFSKALRGQSDHIEGARLWFLLYVCDHNFSIAYGRPPVIHDDATIPLHEAFLQMPGVTQADYRLHSQVAIFRILSQVYFYFGPDPEKSISETDLDSIQTFNADIDAWRAKWQPLLGPNKYLAGYPARGIIMNWNFAKLQVNAYALRGMSPCSTQMLSDKRHHFAQLAVDNALATLEFVLKDPSIRAATVGMPLYLHTMITYAAAFLLKVLLRWRAYSLALDDYTVIHLIESCADLLSNAKTSKRHLAPYMAHGLRGMIAKFKAERLEPEPLPLTIADLERGLAGSSGPDWSSFGVGIMSGDDVGLYGIEQQYLPLGMFDGMAAGMPG
ncbi:hypothetical protein EJ06DRAFT_218864 [Trichodelitschia bisporula]|uniref:Xylanolytic transcriptional activator regulatory domain-containing protein n=1 Tax=Trichodelitschia bisporula TaxID=703511 RepID=A0A6G1I9A9_9PEZI|nr:hypothetical protein EJ06DRAFT_218864 [Trichodelitschia bisporula]